MGPVKDIRNLSGEECNTSNYMRIYIIGLDCMTVSCVSEY